MGRFIAMIFAILALIGAVLSFMGGEVVAGMGALFSFGVLLILNDVLKSLQRHASTQKALAKALATMEFAKEIKRYSDLYSKEELTWAIKTLEEAKAATHQDETKSILPTAEVSNAPALGAPTRTS